MVSKETSVEGDLWTEANHGRLALGHSTALEPAEANSFLAAEYCAPKCITPKVTYIMFHCIREHVLA